MNKRPLGSCDLTLSPISLGTVKFGRNQSVKYPGTFDLPDNTAVSRLLDMALAQGITTLDTAPAYGLSEQRLGELLKQRQQWQIISKAGEVYDTKSDSSFYDYSPLSLRHSLENSLRTLKTDYLDCWLLHSDGNDLDNLNDDVLKVLLDAKQAGWVRSVGMSTKTVEGGQYALEHLDCIMMSASLNHQDEAPLFDIAEQLGKGLLMKKIFDSGWALTGDDKASVMQQTYAQIFKHPAVTSAVVGTINPDHLQQNIDAFMNRGQ